jgi:hypothetical protein
MPGFWAEGFWSGDGTSASIPGATTVLAVCTAAAREINVLMFGETLPSDEGFAILGKLNNILDLWNAKKHTVYAVEWEEFTLERGLSPHTIGPDDATWDADQRPVTIEGASFVYTTGSVPVYVPIHVHDANWWDAQRTPGVESSVPTDVAYVPDWPNGKLYFWPTPDTAGTVRLYFRRVFAHVLLSDAITMPPGYRAALELTLAEWIAPSFGRQVSQDLKDRARDARATIAGNNDVTPPYSTVDSGMPGHRSHGWTWLTGPRW